MVKIAVDALGGDHAPSVVVEGAVLAAKESGGKFHVVLCGPQEIIQSELNRLGYTGDGISIFHAPSKVEMDEAPTQVLKTKQDSGLVACVSLQKAGKVDASISAGNSGAMMAACLMILGRVGNISRPAIACLIPAFHKRVVLLDAGANVDEKPSHLVNFAVCGSVFAENVLKYANAKVGLLNMGEEEKKGPEVLQETHQLLKNAPINFIGNIEGRDILTGEVEVVVAPGYTGNVVLKLLEGFYDLHKKYFGSIDSPQGRVFEKEWDYQSYGGALLVGLNGNGFIAHGRSSAKAICSAIENAYDVVSNNVTPKIIEKISQMAA